MDGLHVVDSSGWLEHLVGGPNARHFTAPLADPGRLLVPTISLYEVFRVVLRERGKDDALQAAAAMRRGREIALSPTLALEAAWLAHERGLAMGDAIITGNRPSQPCDPVDPGRRLRGRLRRTVLRENGRPMRLARSLRRGTARTPGGLVGRPRSRRRR